MSAVTGLVGESRAIAAVRDEIERVVRRQTARRPPTVLIRGETGTGKGVAAHLLHATGPRRGGPFVEVNCAAVPETLVEAELFGVERGSFTDAKVTKSGLFQAAHGGTIFLDEVSLLTPECQAKLLKVLEDRAVRRVGSTKSEPIDVAIVSASNDDLEALVRERRFREDLYHRLAVLVLRMPPLRERDDDILLLAEHFLARVCADYDLPPKTFTAEAETALQAYDWPGNVRELANVIERVALLSEGPWVRAENLRLSSWTPGRRGHPVPGPDVTTPGASAAEAGEEVEAGEREVLIRTLAETNWNISQTAALLKTSRNTLRHRIAKHQLRPVPTRPVPAVAAATEPPAPATEPPPAIGAGAAVEAVRWARCHLATLRVEVRPLRGEYGHDSRAIVDDMIHKLHSFGGIIDAVTPTGLSATFGLEPLDDPVVCAALAAMAVLNHVRSARPAEPDRLGVRSAISAGEQLVARTGDRLFLDAATREDIAKELEEILSAAEWGTTVATAGAWAFLEGRFELMPTAIRSGTGEVVHRLSGRSDSSFHRGGQMSIFVGRQQELELLRAILDAARGGRGQVVGVIGDAGIGKSRLLFEFHRTLLDEPVLYVEGRCVSYGRRSPYLPVLEIVRRICNVGEADPPAQVAASVRAACAELDVPEASSRLVCRLLGAPGERPAAPSGAETVKTLMFAVLVQMLLRRSRRQPAVVVIEDLHWIDTASEEFVATLVDALVMAPVLVMLTYRPGYRSPWIGKSYFTQLALRPLLPQECLSVLRSVALAESLSAPLADVILQRAEGNPLFIEELSRLAGDAACRADLAVPMTIQDALVARTYSLPEHAKSVLQAAAVLGRTVPVTLLEAVCGAPVDAALRELVRQEFLVEQVTAGDRIYAFKHALVLEVVYGGLMAAQREALHLRAGREIERLHASRLNPIYSQLAHHFSRANADETALKYLMLFAQQAAANYAPAEALAALDDALRHLHRLPHAPAAERGERERMTVEIVLRQAEGLHLLGRVEASISVLLGQASRIQQLRDPAMAAQYYFLLGRSRTLFGQPEALDTASLAIQEAESAGDQIMVGKAHYLLALEHCWLGQYPRTFEHAAAARRILEAKDEAYWLGQTSWLTAFAHAVTGEMAAALAAARRVATLGQSIGDRRLESYAEWTIGFISTLIGQTGSGVDHCRRALEYATDPHNRAIVLGYLGHAYLRDGNLEASVACLGQATAQLRESGFRRLEGAFVGLLGEAYLGLEDLPRARTLARQGLELCQASRFPLGAAWCWSALARVAVLAGPVAEARHCVENGLAVVRAIGARADAGHMLLLAADVAAHEGRSADADALREDGERLVRALARTHLGDTFDSRRSA